MQYSKAALVSYSQDLDMLQSQVKSGQFDIYDSVYIVDGPFDYVADQFSGAESYTKLDETKFGIDLLRDKKFKYFYRSFKDELEKRIYAYQLINEDIIFLHDTDEFLSYDLDSFDAFVRDEGFSVASFKCQNLYLDGVAVGEKETKSTSELPNKIFCFKKSLISAEDHINYLWLVNVEQKKPDNTKIFSHPIAVGYHFTQMRSHEGQVTKINFYTSLYYYSNKKNAFENHVFETLHKAIISKKITYQEALDLFLRSNSNFSLAHGFEGPGKTLKRLILSQYLEDCLSEINKKKYVFKQGKHLIFNGLSSWFFIYQPIDRIRISSSFSSTLEVAIYEYCNSHSPKIILKDTFDSAFKYMFSDRNSNSVGFLVCICSRFKSDDEIAELNIDFS